jgi:shikimate 5-dehydrogenase
VQICASTVFDLIYNPLDTKLLQMARAKGCRTISGIEMYLAQAARQFEYWIGRQAPLAKMRKTALAELDQMRQGGARR